MKKNVIVILSFILCFNFSYGEETFSAEDKNTITTGLNAILIERKKHSERLGFAIDFLKSSSATNILKHIIKYEDAYLAGSSLAAITGVAAAAVTAQLDHRNLVYLPETFKNFKYTKISGGAAGLAITALIYLNTSDRLKVYRDLDKSLEQMTDEDIESFVEMTFDTKAALDAQIKIIEFTVSCVEKSKLISDVETCLY